MKKYKVAFICVHNSCRSQMAEAIANIKASDIFDVYSAGTEVKPQINQDAVKIIEKKYGYNMLDKQYSKLISEIPQVDIVVTMGCNVDCPYLPCEYREDWGLDDPTDKEEGVFLEMTKTIEQKLQVLKEKVLKQEII